MNIDYMNYIKPELLVLIPALIFVGYCLKTSTAVADKLALVTGGRYTVLPCTDTSQIACIGAISNGDAVSFYQLAEAEGWTKDNKYMARYVG